MKQEFIRDGYLAAINAMPSGSTAAYAEKCLSFIDEYHEHSSYSQWTYSKSEIVLRWVAELAREKFLLDVVEELIGPNILLWNAFLPIKPPQSTASFGWHQDATYWPIAPLEQVVTAWVALSSVDQQCGGMQMLRGSHLLGPVPHEVTYDKTSMLRRGQRVCVPVDESQLVAIDLEPGQASIHHTLMLHRSHANSSDNWRLGVGFNFVSSSVGPIPGYRDSATLLRGCADGTGFDLTETPRRDLDEAALQMFAEVQELQSKRYADIESAPT